MTDQTDTKPSDIPDADLVELTRIRVQATVDTMFACIEEKDFPLAFASLASLHALLQPNEVVATVISGLAGEADPGNKYARLVSGLEAIRRLPEAANRVAGRMLDLDTGSLLAKHMPTVLAARARMEGQA